MPSYARKWIVADGAVAAYHLIARCVRRAMPTGKDAASRRGYW